MPCTRCLLATRLFLARELGDRSHLGEGYGPWAVSRGPVSGKDLPSRWLAVDLQPTALVYPGGPQP